VVLQNHDAHLAPCLKRIIPQDAYSHSNMERFAKRYKSEHFTTSSADRPKHHDPEMFKELIPLRPSARRVRPVPAGYSHETPVAAVCEPREPIRGQFEAEPRVTALWPTFWLCGRPAAGATCSNRARYGATMRDPHQSSRCSLGSLFVSFSAGRLRVVDGGGPAPVTL
jgi:hypothetical protein